MSVYSYIEEDLGTLCRSCLNKKYNVKLTPKNCEYDDYPRLCYRCEEIKNIVCGIKPGKRLLLRLKS